MRLVCAGYSLRNPTKGREVQVPWMTDPLCATSFVGVWSLIYFLTCHGIFWLSTIQYCTKMYQSYESISVFMGDAIDYACTCSVCAMKNVTRVVCQTDIPPSTREVSRLTIAGNKTVSKLASAAVVDILAVGYTTCGPACGPPRAVEALPSSPRNSRLDCRICRLSISTNQEGCLSLLMLATFSLKLQSTYAYTAIPLSLHRHISGSTQPQHHIDLCVKSPSFARSSW